MKTAVMVCITAAYFYHRKPAMFLALQYCYRLMDRALPRFFQRDIEDAQGLVAAGLIFSVDAGQ